MYQADYKGINAFLKCSCELLLNKGKKRIINDKICYELPEPYMFKIEKPTARLVTIPQRKWFVTLPYAESLWLASGKMIWILFVIIFLEWMTFLMIKFL